MTAVPQVSVIIPTYNYGQFIMAAVESVLNQSYPKDKIEIIVVDDGSTDLTADILRPYILRNDLQFYYQINKGKANATKKAIEKSKGKYIFNLDADDYFLPKKIENFVQIFESDPTISHVASAAIHVNGCNTTVEKLPMDIVGKPIDGRILLDRFYANNILFGGGSTFAARSSVIKAINIPDSVDMFIDEFLILAVLRQGKSYFLQAPQSVWRVHGLNYSRPEVPTEAQKSRGTRLLMSSRAVLTYLRANNFSTSLVRIYKLQHANRHLAYKESINEKSPSDICKYVFDVAFLLRPSWTVMRKYSVFNRMMPTSLLKILKGIKICLKVKTLRTQREGTVN